MPKSNNPPKLIPKPIEQSNRKLVPMSQMESKSNDGVVVNIDDILVDIKVKHSRFGIGIVVEITGEAENKKASITFENGETKTLLLKFAKLELVG